MAYIGTSAFIKSLGISKKALYSLINSGEIEAPIKKSGRYLWSEKDATAVVCALARRSTLDALAFDQEDKRYLGGKAKYAQFIRDVADQAMPGFESFTDYFAGTGGSAAAFSDKTIIANDLLYSSYLFLQAWYSPQKADMQKVTRYIAEYNKVNPAGENYVSQNFAGKYFGAVTARKIGFIRQDIEDRYQQGDLNERERAVLLASLLCAMDDAANIYAHYDTFKPAPFTWEPLELRVPAVSNENSPENRIFNTDANMLAPYTYSDIAYLDPPIDSRQYSDIYHLPENIAVWAKPELKGKTMKNPRGHIKSLYCKKGADEVFAQMVEQCNAEVILAAIPEKQEGRGTRSAAKLSADEMMRVLRKKGSVSIQFPPFAAKEQQTGQLLLSYEFKKTAPVLKENANLKGGLMVCRCGRKEPELIDSPINFAGGKFRELDKLRPYFPVDCKRVWDVFAGGCSVGINAGAEQICFVEQDAAVMGLFRAMKQYGKDVFTGQVRHLIEKYRLSDTAKYGYEYYGVTAEIGLANVNKSAYIQLREDFNKKEEKDLSYYAMLYVLLVYGFNNIPRFNRNGEFNLPAGKRDWNLSMQNKLEAFLQRLEHTDAQFYAMDFRNIDAETLTKEDFVYLDPPYIGAAAYYNRQMGWTEQDERDLMAFLDKLDAYGIPYALSAVRSYGGIENTVLEQWLQYGMDTHRVIRRDPEDKDKVLILNY